MRLYTSQGTNPRIVELFLEQKEIAIDRVWIDIGKGENRTREFLQKNALGQLPVLELDSGQCFSQITAIVEFLEELYPQPPLIGSTPEERAQTRMWLRRCDLLIVEPLTQAFQYSEGLFYYQNLIHCIPDAVEDLKQIARKNIAWLDGQIAGKQFICGDRFTFVDIRLFCALEFACNVGQPVDSANANICGWMKRIQVQLGIG